MSFIFPFIFRIDKDLCCLLSPRSTTDNVNRSSKRLRLMNYFDRSSKRGQRQSRRNFFSHRSFHLATFWKKNFLWENFWFPRSNHFECDMSLHTTLLTKVFVKSAGRLEIRALLLAYYTLEFTSHIRPLDWQPPIHWQEQSEFRQLIFVIIIWRRVF